MVAKLLVFLSLLIIPSVTPYKVFAQEDKRVSTVYDFTGGVNNKFPSISIADNQAQDAINVLFDQGTIKKRGGYRKQNTTVVPGPDINGVFEFYKSNGQSYVVVFSSSSGYYSVDGGITFTVFISTLSSVPDVNCAQLSDRLYCVNGVNTAFYFDGANDYTDDTMPLARYIRTYQNRLWIAGNPANLSRVYFSDVNNGTSWDTVFNFVDFNPDNGDIITGIGEPLFESLPVYKKYSSYVCQGESADSYKPVMVNATIGALHHRSIKNFLLKNQTIQVFDSLGQYGSRNGIYYNNGIVVQYLSENVEGYMRNVTNFASLEKFKNWSTQNDWVSGNSYLTSPYISQNELVPSTWGVVDSGPEWDELSSVNIDTLTYETTMLLKYTTGQNVVIDNFNNSSIDSRWFIYGDAVSKVTETSRLRYGYDGTPAPGTTYVTTLSSGSILASTKVSLFANLYRSAAYAMDSSVAFEFISDSTDTTISNGYGNTIYCWQGNDSKGPTGNCSNSLFKSVNGVKTVLVSKSFTFEHAVAFAAGVNCDQTITISSSSDFIVVKGTPTFYDSAPIDAQFCNITYATQLENYKERDLNKAMSFKFYKTGTYGGATGPSVAGLSTLIEGYSYNGNYTSKVYDSYISTPIGGPFDFDISVPVGSTIAFHVRGANSSAAVLSAPWQVVNSTITGNFKLDDKKRYWQYEADFSTLYSTQSPSLYSVGLNLATTGYWETPDTFVSNNMASWGLFVVVSSQTGGAGWTYYVKSANSQAGLASSTYNLQTVGELVNASTGTWFKGKAVSSIKSSSETLTLNGITIYYNEGSTAKGSVACVYDNRYYWFAQASTETVNNMALVMDYDGAFSKFDDVPVRSCTIYNNQLYTGGSKNTNIYVHDQGSDDDGNPFTASWTSKNYPLTNEELDKTVENVFVTLRKNATPVGVYVFGDDGPIYNWSINNAASTSSQNYVTAKLDVTPEYGNIPSSYFNLNFSETSVLPWEIIGFKFYWSPQYLRGK